MSEHHLFYVAVHVFLIKNNQVLLLERQNTGWMDGFFSVPAGHVDGNETIWTAAKRELLEEAGVQITREYEPVHVMHRIRPGHERIDYFFVLNEWNGEPKNNEPDKCAQLKWFPLNSLPKNTIQYITFALENISAKKIWSEFTE